MRNENWGCSGCMQLARKGFDLGPVPEGCQLAAMAIDEVDQNLKSFPAVLAAIGNLSHTP